MASTATELSPRLPLGVRWIERSRVEPLWNGLALGLALGVFVLATETHSGVVGRVFRGELPTLALRAPLIAMLMIGLAPAGQAYLVRWTSRNLRNIAPLVNGGAPGAPPSAAPPAWPGWVGALTFIALFHLPNIDEGALEQIARPTVHALYPFAMVPVLGWLTVRFLVSIVMDARRVSSLAYDLREIDLLDPRPLAPFVQQGLQGALLAIGIITVSSVLSLSPGKALPGTILLFAVVFTVAALALLAPLVGVRRRIRDEKQRQLATLRSEVDGLRRAVLGGHADGDAVARLPGLLALESRIEAVREWPLDTSNLARFALYMSVGLGSWIGAAAVERLIDWSLG